MMSSKCRLFIFVSSVIFLLVITTGCATSPSYRLDSGEPIALTNGPGSVLCTYQELLNKVDSVLDNVLPYTISNSSEIDAMMELHNRLEDIGIKVAFVAINVLDNKPFYSCIAVETADKGLVYLSLVTQSMGTEYNLDRSVYIQATYLEIGEKLGFVEAKYAQSFDYSWYLEYLQRFYRSADFYKYLEKYGSVIDENSAALDKISQNLDNVYDQLSRYQKWPMSRSLSDIAMFNRLADDYDIKIKRYNQNIETFNAQVNDYNSELQRGSTLAEGTSEFIYAVEEIPGLTAPYTVTMPNITIPEWTIMPAPSVVSPYSSFLLYPTLDEIQRGFSFDDTYNQIPKPDMQSVEKFERISDDNFVVTNYKLWW
jgi:hypothetical protein